MNFYLLLQISQQRVHTTFNDSKPEIVRQVENGIRPFDVKKKTCLATEFSKVGLGLQLLQKNCDLQDLSPICYPSGWNLVFANSRFNLPVESRYDPIEGKCLADCWAIKKCKYFLLGCEFFSHGT